MLAEAQTPVAPSPGIGHRATPITDGGKFASRRWQDLIAPLLVARRALFAATPATLDRELYENADGSVIQEIIEEPILTENPAMDLQRWFNGYLPVPQLAELCGAKTRRYYDWLNGEGMRAATARRLYEVRALLHPVIRECGASGAMDWLYSPASEGESPFDLITRRDNRAVIRLLQPFLTSTGQPGRRIGLMPAERDDYEIPSDAAYEAGGVVSVLEIEP